MKISEITLIQVEYNYEFECECGMGTFIYYSNPLQAGDIFRCEVCNKEYTVENDEINAPIGFYERKTEYATLIKNLMRLELTSRLNRIVSTLTVEYLLKIICDNVPEELFGKIHPSRIAMELGNALFDDKIPLDDIDWDEILIDAQDVW